MGKLKVVQGLAGPSPSTFGTIGVLGALRQKVLPDWTDLWPEIVASAKKGEVLHLGPGRSPLPGAVTIDMNPSTKPGIIHDLNLKPWPFNDSTFDGVVALSILEHLDDFLGVMAEVHRVSKAGAVTSMLVPHFSSMAPSLIRHTSNV